jgi:HEAT repeat protein
MTIIRLKADATITHALKTEADLNVSSVFDLLKCKQSYSHAIPVLLKYLPQIDEPWIKEGIVRALTIKEARGKADAALLKEFLAIPPHIPELQNLKWAIGNALSIVATEPITEQLIEIATTPRHGKAREMVVVALANVKSPKVVEVLIRLLQDDAVCGFAASALAKLKATEAGPYIAKLRNHSKPWVRKEAEKALAKLVKADLS